MPRARQTIAPAPALPEPLRVGHAVVAGDPREDGEPMSLAKIQIGPLLVHVYEALNAPGKAVIDVIEGEADVADGGPTSVPFVVTVNDDTVFERKAALTLARGTRHALESAVRADVRNHYGQDGYRLGDEAAAAIASWYQASGGPGLVFAEFVSHSPVDPEALALACEREIAAHEGRADWSVRALKMLAAYARSA